MIDAAAVRRLREALGLSQEELGKRSGVSQTTIALLESGKQPTAKKLPQLAKALGVPPGEIDPEFWTVIPPEEDDPPIDPEALQELLSGSYKALGLDEDESAVLTRAVLRDARTPQSPAISETISDRVRALSELIARAFPHRVRG